MKKLLAILALALPVFAQSNTGELRVTVVDPSGLGVRSSIELVSEANQFSHAYVTDDSGHLVAKELPFGLFKIEVHRDGFAPFSSSLEIHSAIPIDYSVKLNLASLTTAVQVSDADTLINPDQPGAVNRIGSATIQTREASLPGRSLQDLVNSQPGWLYEGNAVLHPRESEYQTQFVVNGVPLTDNRSPSFGPEIEADDVDSLSVYTAGIPAEYGRKMGGVVEVNTTRNTQEGWHGELVLSGGSFDTAGAFAQVQDVWGKNAFGASAEGSATNHYLNPVVPQNYTNTGTTGDFSLNYERDFTDSDRLTLSVRHELSRFQIPNEQLQQSAGQLQSADNFETMGIVAYQHIFSPNVVGDVRAMIRSDSSDLDSNPLSTPVIAVQHNWFQEGYFKGTISIHHNHQEWKAGIESDTLFLHETFSDAITDPDRFDDGTPAVFSFASHRPDLEQSAFVQDLIHLDNWTISAGLRWDHYQLLVNQNALSPRLSLARYFHAADLMIHASYDRVFQTPSFENILLSSSPAVVALNPNVLRLPVEPSHGDYYEAGLTKGFFGNVRLDANYFRRIFDNFADDDQLLNTAISFPIAFRKAIIYGAETKIEIPHWRNLSGNVSYSYSVGNVWFPVTGGLFLGDNAVNASTQLSGHIPVSQDQRNTVRTRVRYQIAPRLWAAIAAEYGSGLPFDFDGTLQQALAQYGQQVVDRINFARGRIRPNLSIDVSVGADLYKSERMNIKFQADGENLNNRLNVIDFGGLFSGNAIAPSRSFALRLSTTF